MAASFTKDHSVGDVPLAVAFTDTSIGSPSAWDWDFGDGSAHATTQNPTHTYTSGGSFTVTLTATISGSPSVATAVIQVNPVFNCACDDETSNETLAQLRRRLLVRLGYSAQADNPPPGMADLLDDFLRSSQRVVYSNLRAELRTERFFSWTMVAGQRFYDLPDNDETCSKELNPYEVHWVGLQDLNNAWYTLVAGIPPNYYTSVAFPGYPSFYEIRQCIEVFPAPAAAYKLWIKGRFGLTSFTDDADKTTVDSELVFLWSLGVAKAHYGQQDAGTIAAQASTYLKRLNAGAHLTKRYIPGGLRTAPWTQPRFLPVPQ